MKKNTFLISLLTLFLCFTACSDSENSGGTEIKYIKGVTQKGPFVAGTSVSVYELDANLKATGLVFEAKTDDEGAFTINPSTSLISNYVKLSANGFYFNEYTGELSDAPISLEAITSIDSNSQIQINVNILTHLEMPRVMELVSQGNKFEEAKAQAQKDVLKAFLITDEAIIPEEASITANNTSANILIAISSILLNNRSDAQFTEFMNMLRHDLIDGEITEDMKSKIAESSLKLSYSRIKDNIQKRYEELGKTVEVGNFEIFIDGDGDGQIGDTYDEEVINVVEPDDFLTTEKDAIAYLNASAAQMCIFIQHQHLFDGLYTQTVSGENTHAEFREIYNHKLTPHMNLVGELWNNAYHALQYDNIFIEKSQVSSRDWMKQYQCYSRTHRAYKYLQMINLWGDVPLITSTTIENFHVSRTPQEEILNFIISELQDVYHDLPENSSDFKCSSYFAKAIQAKAHLYKQEYNQALACINILIDSGKFSLSNDIPSIHAGGNNEILFELPIYNEGAISTYYKDLIQKGEYVAITRYTEVLLMAAEASMQLGGQTHALEYLNQVRNRNGRPNLEDTQSIEDALIAEWKEDLKNEGEYFATLKRLNKAKEVLNIEEYQLLLPIPSLELYNNYNMTQNPGY